MWLNGIGAGSGRIVGTGSYWKLTADIDLNGSETFQWTPIGYFTSDADYYAFGGTFDGNGHTIANLFINASYPDLPRVGLFSITGGANIKNVGITGNTVVKGWQYAGGLVGYANYGNRTVFDNCYNTGSVSCSYSASAAFTCLGGIVGYGNATVNNCYNTGSVSCSYSAAAAVTYSGGIVGYGNATVNNCYNTGSVSSSSNSSSGGIVGTVSGGSTAVVNNCYNTGTLSGRHKYGIAPPNNSTVNNSYYLVTCGATQGGVSKTEAFMKDTEFVQLLNNGEGFVYKQDMVPYTNNGYPVFTQGFEMQFRPAGNITQTKATLKCLLVTGDVSITAKQLVCNGKTVNLSSTDTLLVHTVSGLTPDTEYPYTFRAISSANDTCKLTATFSTLAITATTHEATDITQTKATLNGEVVFGDATVTKGFEYRLSTETGFTTVEVSSSEANITSRLENLLPAQAYRFRTFCTVSDATFYGEIQNFSTLAFNTEGDDYLIEDREDLILLAELVNEGNSFSGQTFILKNDITLPITPNNIHPIGKYAESFGEHRPFSGTFHGNGKRIYNVYIDEPNTPYQGFFGYTKDAYLYEVGLVNITASGRNYTGGMVGYAENTRINDSYVSGGTLFALSYCGGLVGYQTPGTNSVITGCYNTCTVTGNNYTGGLLGYSNEGTVRNSYVAALVTGMGSTSGAIIGGALNVLNYNCYFNDSITGQTVAIGENVITKSSKRAECDEGGMSSDDIRMQEFVNTLNQGLVTPVWKADYEAAINSGFPILIWQGSGSSGIAMPAEETVLTLYPNPATGYLFIESGTPVKRVDIYSQSGICVQSVNNPDGGIDVSALPSGLYLVRLYTGGTPVNRKIMIRK